MESYRVFFWERWYDFTSDYSAYCMEIKLSHGIKQEYLQDIILASSVVCSKMVATQIYLLFLSSHF